jgi:hypothetical protein
MPVDGRGTSYATYEALAEVCLLAVETALENRAASSQSFGATLRFGWRFLTFLPGGVRDLIRDWLVRAGEVERVF